MRPLLMCALFAAVAPAEELTVVLDFEGPVSTRSVAEMKREFEGIVKDAHVNVTWRTPQQAEREAVPNLVVVRFKDKCVLEPEGFLYDERGPMAFTYSTGGVMQPFSEVACDQVTAVVRSAMSGGDFARADMLMGRALARVVAHEVVHILSGDGRHGSDGVARKSLSGNQLIAPRLRLAREDLERLRFHR